MENSKSPKQKKKQKHLNKKRSKSSLFIKTLWLIGGLCLVCLVGSGSIFAYYASQAPEINEEALIDPIPSEILDKNGNVVARLGTKHRELIEYEDLPSQVEQAVLATEDERFYDHYGIDPIRLGKAVLANITEGYGSEGASTITQQVIKRSFLTSEKTLERKAKEAWLAIKFEQNYSKKEILEFYLNKTYYSDNIYGIETAAHYYYNKSLDELSLAQVALLAGIPQSPNNYNPYDSPEKAEERRNIVLSLMHQHNKISHEQMEKAQQVSVTKGIVDRSSEERTHLTKDKGFDAFIDHVIDQLDEQGDYNIYEEGLRIHTTLDPKAQAHVEKILDTEEVINYPNDKPFQAGITLLDTQTGAIRAIGGGRNYGSEVKRGFNFAIDNQRQPGSVIKPILVYAPAIEKNKWSTAHIIDDEPIEYEDGGEPANWDGEFKGDITIREALWDSRNIPAIKVFNETGHDYATEFAKGLGMNFNGETLYESAAIGGMTTGTSSMEIAGAYAALGNEGGYNEPYVIKKIEFRDGSSKEYSTKKNTAMDNSTAFMVTDMLKEVVKNPQATGTTAAVPGVEVAGKTGTTNYTDEYMKANDIAEGGTPDSWFAGYTTEYTAAIWTGYKDRKHPLTNNETRISQKIFSNLMEKVTNEEDNTDFNKPNDIVELDIEEGTEPAKLASDFTPDGSVTKELFFENDKPSDESNQFVPSLPVPSNLTTNYHSNDSSITLRWDYYQDEQDDRSVTFDITTSVDGNERFIGSTESEELTINNIEQGKDYTFYVQASTTGDESSKASVDFILENSDDKQDDDNQTSDDSSNQDDDNQTSGDSSNQDDDNQTSDDSSNQDDDNQTSGDSSNQDDDNQTSDDSSNQDNDNQTSDDSSNQDDDNQTSDDSSNQGDDDQTSDDSSNQGDDDQTSDDSSNQGDDDQTSDDSSNQDDNQTSNDSSNQDNDDQTSDDSSNQDDDSNQDDGN
ncbi:transglycosylase domain-containing protein [Aquibacillus rhizosphaerae]|uniref:PBP1A family penicillin-binding protein n=1 Tax=Aquibacillus rhizosphaerae TaxID=3051431 RepID=A0ABT7L5R8_9BACI|nr:PBP1A family penicillin-binding protein [Aquibacillus sp. LR5S19]MDL4841200.1 PBP1A family penicillin-binding protein [Aquibacillus sp. LR5S19]